MPHYNITVRGMEVVSYSLVKAMHTQNNIGSYGKEQRLSHTIRNMTYHASDPGERGSTQKFLDGKVEGKLGPAGDVEAHVGELNVVVVRRHAELVWPIDCHRSHLEKQW